MSSVVSAGRCRCCGHGGPGLGALAGSGRGEAVGVGAGLDDVAAEGEAVDDGRAEAGVGEGLGPAAEDSLEAMATLALFLAFGQDLEQQLGAAAVEFHVAELVDLCGHPHRSTYADTATMPMLLRTSLV